jgi:hypothetical protein
MEQEIKKLENNSKNFWQFTIALIVIVLVVLAGGVIIILLQGGHSISGKEAASGAAFPLVPFILIWIVISIKKERPTPKQSKVIKAMLITALILLMVNALVFWLL